MDYCTKCCQSLTRPNLTVKDGVCGACLWEEEKKTINWDERLNLLRIIADKAKTLASERGTYDVVLGVSGGKDSTFTALYAKEVLGLNCLLVSAYPDQISEIGEHNFQNLVKQGFDVVRMYINPKLVAELMKRDFLKYCHFRKANEYPLWASTFMVAKEKNIPLIIQGENAALTLGISQGMNTDWDASTIWKTNTIAGASAMEHFKEIPSNRLLLFQFPDMTQWKENGGKAVWLNYFVKEYSPLNNALFATARGLQVRQDNLDEIGRIHKWTCLDSDFHIVSQMHKYYKHGFGFATDEVCYDIREGILDRESGFDLIKKFDGKCAKRYVKAFCDFIGITEKEHWEVVAKFKKYDPLNRWAEQTAGIL